MKKLERLIYIVILLRCNHGLRVPTLAEKCGVTERTIYRDISSLFNVHVPIFFDNGYKIIKESYLPPNNFSDEESNFMLKLLKSSGESCISKRVINKIQASMSV